MPEDLDALLVVAEQDAFGAPWEIRSGAGVGWSPIPGVFDRRHVEALDGEGVVQSTRRVTLIIRAASLAPGRVVQAGDLVRRGTDVWQVTDAQPDAMGGILLILGARVGGAAAP